MGSPNSSSFLRRLRLTLILLLGLLAFLVIEPHTLRFLLKHGLTYQARKNDADLRIGRVDGSIFGTFIFHDIRLASSQCGVISEIKISQAEAHFYWKALFGNQGKGFFHRLSLAHLDSTITFNASGSGSRERRRYPKSWLPTPTQLDLWDGNLAIILGERSAHLTDIQVSVDSASPGAITIGKVVIQEQGVTNQTFENLRGVTAIQGTRLLLADLQLGPNIWLKALTTDLANLTQGRVKVGFDFSAFTGTIRGELVNAPREKYPHYEVAGSFGHISVNQLAEFLKTTEKADGIIKEGKFTFRGSPQALDKATFSTWFEATDFLWAKRQWNSLSLGASVINRRIHIPELYLQQAHNILKLKGEILLPPNGTPWWQSEFNFDIAAQIDSLKELSDLVGPRVAETSGKMTIDGSVRGLNKTFSGQLIVAGKQLSYRNTPFDLLHAGIKLDGNELHVINLEIARGRDFIRGKGVVNILGDKRYWGELNANIRELSAYREVLEKPITPVPLEGGIVLDWSGDGGADYHSGAFTARLRKMRTPGTTDVPATLPIDAELEGTYAPGSIFLSTCKLANGETQLETRLSSLGSSLKLEGIKLSQKNTHWLEGDATLPVNMIAWWLAPGMDALAPDDPINVKLTARGVQLDEVGHLTGRPIPISGLLSGSIQTEGTLRALQMTGALTLSKGRLPKTAYLPELEQLEAEADLTGKVFRFTKLNGKALGGSFSATGAIDLTEVENPALELAVKGEKMEFSTLSSAFAGSEDAPAEWSGRTAFDITVSGAAKAATLSGEIRPETLTHYPTPDFAAFLGTGESERIAIVPPRFTLPSPYQNWQTSLHLTTGDTPLKLKSACLIGFDLLLSNQEEQLQSSGSITYQKIATRGNITYQNIDISGPKGTAKGETAVYHWTDAAQPPYLVASTTTHHPFSAGSPGTLYRYFVGALPHLATATISQREMAPAPFLLFEPTDAFKRLTLDGETFSFYERATPKAPDETSEAEADSPVTQAAAEPEPAMP